MAAAIIMITIAMLLTIAGILIAITYDMAMGGSTLCLPRHHQTQTMRHEGETLGPSPPR